MKNSTLLFLSIVACALSACQPPVEPVVDKPLALTVSADSIVCLANLKDQLALEMSWTAGTNHGTGSAIAYTLKMDTTGNAFQGGATWEIGKTTSRMMNFTHAQLNDTLLQYFPDIDYTQPISVDFQVIATIIATGDVQRSKPITVVITPYRKHVLYMVGDATPNGWSREPDRVIQIIADAQDTCLYRWSGKLKRGTFKFLCSRTSDNWLPAYMPDPADDSKVTYVETEGIDRQWRIINEGSYSISLNTRDLTIIIKALTPPEEIDPELYIIGSATQWGWDMNKTQKMLMYLVESDTVFRWSGKLYYNESDSEPGAFKFLTTYYDWNPCYVADGSDPTSMKYREGDGEGNPPDIKWHINATADYAIEANISDMTLSLTHNGMPVYEHLYMVGDATPNGWSLDQATELQPSHDQVNVFTWTGNLTAGSLKFAPQHNSFDGMFFFASAFNRAPLNDDVFEIGLGSEHDDKKWEITATEAGQYRITVNASDLTISFVKL